MSRLTKKISKTVQDKYSLGSYLCYDFSNTDNINELLNKLGRIEDFMEDYTREVQSKGRRRRPRLWMLQ